MNLKKQMALNWTEVTKMDALQRIGEVRNHLKVTENRKGTVWTFIT